MKIVTIGVYGFTADTFFQALQTAGVDVFYDIRWRRGVRGKDYAFANHKRLVSQLESLGIQYVYDRGLAPTPEIRQLQKDADKEVKVAKRKRNLLSSGFKAAYKHEILADFDPQDFLDCLPDEAKTIALCCVERQPEACHRHLVADLLQNAFGMEVDHLLPENAI